MTKSSPNSPHDGNVAVVEIEEGFDGTPKMISERAVGVRRIVEIWTACNVGKTDRCEFSIAKKKAKEIAARLNG